MDKEKNKYLYIIIGVLIIVVLLLGGYIIYDKVLSSNNSTNTNYETKTNNETNEEKIKDNGESLTDLEKEEINKFLDVYENSLMAHLKFDNPSKILNEDNFEMLTQLMISLDSSKKLPSEGLDKTSFTLANIKDTLKSLTNYDYSEEEIKATFSELYDSKENAYVYAGGGGFLTFKLVDGSKKDNNYYVTITNEEITDTISIVLQKNNDKYYYYSSTGY